MAENKKSFIGYVDWGETFDMLDDMQAGKLIKHFFSYIRDENPVMEDKLLAMAFLQIKLQLKRDLAKWDDTKETKAISGALGNLKRWNLDLYEKVIAGTTTIEEAIIIAKDRKLSHPFRTVAVNDNVNGNVTVTDNVKKIGIEERKINFATSLKDFVSEYGRDTVKDFYNYWIEPNKSNTKMRWEMEKTWDTNLRLHKWASNNFKNNRNAKSNNSGEKLGTSDARCEKLEKW